MLIAVDIDDKQEIRMVRTIDKDNIFGGYTDTNISQLHNNIEGITIHNGRLNTSNGSKKRYSANNKPITVIYKIKDENSFIVSDMFGKIDEMTNKQLIKQKKRLSNGKVVRKENVEYISSIKGSYENIKRSDIHDQRRSEQAYTRGNQWHSIRCTDETTKQQNDVDGGTVHIGRVGQSGEGKKRTQPGDNQRIPIYGELKNWGCNTNTKPKDFYRFIEEAKRNNPYAACLGGYTEEEYAEMKCISFDKGLGGLAIHGNDIVSVFKNDTSSIKGFINLAVVSAVINGGDRLDCYSIEGRLPTMYCRQGFMPVCKIRFNRQYAPDNWNYERDGEPDIVFMRYCGDSIEEMQKNRENYKAYNDYSEDEIPYITDKNGVSAYERAYKLRDIDIEEDYFKENIVYRLICKFKKWRLKK